MLYFKTILFPENANQPELEKALRKFALKKNSSLDFKSSTMNIGTDKIFLGVEGKTSLQFTRIKTSFEVMLPKLIISLPKSQTATTYKVRLSAVPFAVCLFISFSIFSNIVGLINGMVKIEFTILTSIMVIIFFLFLSIELKLLKSGVIKSIKNYRQQ